MANNFRNSDGTLNLNELERSAESCVSADGVFIAEVESREEAVKVQAYFDLRKYHATLGKKANTTTGNVSYEVELRGAR